MPKGKSSAVSPSTSSTLPGRKARTPSRSIIAVHQRLTTVIQGHSAEVRSQINISCHKSNVSIGPRPVIPPPTFPVLCGNSFVLSVQRNRYCPCTALLSPGSRTTLCLCQPPPRHSSPSSTAHPHWTVIKHLANGGGRIYPTSYRPWASLRTKN